ncbi:hypothetical protein ACFWPQ_05005 [Streptomyces sp. NPDC058464]|uniref:hypothetical protein n=1 Tax=Streptomyces sp. NPDC058464 TaxID=3346511 RepID=UPI00365E578D
MPMSDPYQAPDFTVLVTVLFTGLAALLGLAGYLASRLTRQNLGSRTPPTVWREMSLTAVTGSLALYLWGCLHLVFLERQEIGNECAKKAEGVRVAAFHGDFVPLRLVCRTDADRSYTVVVPGYLNPSLAVLLLLALACAITAAVLHRRQRTAKTEERPTL